MGMINTQNDREMHISVIIVVFEGSFFDDFLRIIRINKFVIRIDTHGRMQNRLKATRAYTFIFFRGSV